MANKKYKLTDGNYWATDGVYDFDQGKTQREVNGDLIGAITSVNVANTYTSLLDVINAVKATKALPFSLKKDFDGTFTDVPTSNGSNAYRFTAFVYGDSNRLSCEITIYGVSRDKFIRAIANDSWFGTWDQMATQERITSLQTVDTTIEKGLAIIVTGDTCSIAVPSGGYAYIKDNTHGLTEGLYRNKSSSAFPTSGGTANSTVFEAVPNGGLNSVKESLNSFVTSMDGKRIDSGNILTDYAAVGFQFDSNRIVVFVSLPFIARNANYSVQVYSCSILGIGSIPTTDITVDSKNYNYIRFMIARSGTIGTPFAVTLGLTLNFN